MPTPPSTPNESSRRTLRRRDVLAGVATATAVSTAGCSSIIDALADQILGDVNLFNETDHPVAGSIEIAGPDGSTVLSESFGLEAQAGDDETNDDASTVYEDVWEDAGEYDAVVELDDGVEVRGQSRAETTVTIDDPDEKMLAVAFGVDEEDDGIHFASGDSLSEFE